MSKFTFSRPIMIFANEYNGKKYYKYGQSRKDVDGNWVNGYIDCRFRNGVEIPNKTLIQVKDAWQDFFVKEGKTYTYTFINEFEIVNEENEELEDVSLDDILGEDTIEIDESELSFN